MRSQTVTQSIVGSSIPLIMDVTKPAPFAVGMGVVVTGTVTYTVQHTFDDPFSSTGLVTWFNHPTLATLSANGDSNYAFPVRAIRLNVSAVTGGSATLTVIQAGL
jgi:hypothetical protein